MWFRRDLRLHDNPALLEAASSDGRVVPLFVIDPRVWDHASEIRRAYLARSLTALDTSLGSKLVVRHGDPSTILAMVAAESGSESVHIASDFGPYGPVRDLAIEASLEIPLVRTGSPYAVAPGRVTKADGTAYRVYTPFYRAWLKHGWRSPAQSVATDWVSLRSDGIPAATCHIDLPPAGEAAALARWQEFRSDGVRNYADERNRPDLAGTSMLGHHLKWGEIHPRTILADLGDGDGEDVFRKEIAWREFYADVFHQRPDSIRQSLDSRYDTDFPWADGPAADLLFDAWTHGQTGYPMVDAGMRQLRETGWMHNRVRMIVASFLVKDLHLPWQRGAAHFMTLLRDGDIASNAHGWQWTAGCGTDASPYYRVFNPVTQGLKFDPDGDYVRTYIPELRHIAGKSVHEPWTLLDGYAHDYPERILDHAAERDEALARFSAMKELH
jgi:deoxyribodipyrimidine photo-lyase